MLALRAKPRLAAWSSLDCIAWLMMMVTGDCLPRGLPEAPAIRAITVHPLQPEVMYVGTQHGPYRSTDQGNHWEKVNIPDHGLPVWSLMFHPLNPKVMFAGYESCEIYRSDKMEPVAGELT